MAFRQITEHSQERATHPYRQLVVPPPSDPRREVWDTEFASVRERSWLQYNCHVREFVLAEHFLDELRVALRDHQTPGRTIQRIYAHLDALRAPESVYTIPGRCWDDCGIRSSKGESFFEKMSSVISRILNRRYARETKVLEAMCGSWSYFSPRCKSKKEVVLADGSIDLLEKHAYPDRKRFLVNFDDVQEINALTKTAGAPFDLVSITMGIRYLANPSQTCSALRLLLRPGGKIVFVEAPACGWPAAMKSLKAIEEWNEIAQTAGFINPRQNEYSSLPRRSSREGHKIVLCEATAV